MVLFGQEEGRDDADLIERAESGPGRQPGLQQEVAGYLHVPFCRSRCAYCDFNTTAGLDHLIPAYVDALVDELRSAPEPLTAPTVYFGGGTPSILPLDGLAALLYAVRETFHVPGDAEITLEANPGTVTRAFLRDLRELGVNRLSLGIQSAHDAELALLGRAHTWAEAVAAVAAARATGFDNLSLDFICGLPGQQLDEWRRTLEAALALAPEHLSLYALSLEAGTPLARRVTAGALPAPDDDTAAAMIELAEELLEAAGFAHYELSNWARRTPMPRVCRHNLVYWRNEPYLGFGAGASSWRGGARWTNVRHPQEYIDRIAAGRSVAEEWEDISPQLEMGETMMMGLRLDEGVSDARFRARFDVGLEAVFGAELTELARLDLLEWDGQVARLTARGRLLGNQVFGCFLPD